MKTFWQIVAGLLFVWGVAICGIILSHWRYRRKLDREMTEALKQRWQ